MNRQHNFSRVAVTGASGVLGRHLIAHLAAEGISAAAIGRAEWDLREWRDPAELDDLLGGVEAVFHFGAAMPGAGSDPRALLDANVRACAALGLWATERRIPIVFTGSAGIYAASDRPADEAAAQADCPVGNLYGLTKLLAERLLVGLTGLDLCVLRISSVYGAGLASGKMVAKMLAAASQGEPIQLSAPADDRINLVHAGDVARAAIMALRAGARGSFNIGGPAMVTVEEIAQAAVHAAGRGKVLQPSEAGRRQPECRFHISLDRARRAFGFVPEISLIEGMSLTLRGQYVS